MIQSGLRNLLVAGAVCLTACGERMPTQSNATADRSPARAALSPDRDPRARVGALYVSTNGATGNAVVAFARHADGSLSKIGQFTTGGAGTGGGVDPLQSQGALALSSGHRQLFVVNAGSNAISTFEVRDDGALDLIGTVSSRGSEPISLTVSGERLFVLNADNTVAGFAVRQGANPEPVGALVASLGLPSDGPSTIVASRDGKQLFVTQRNANAIDALSVSGDVLSAPTRNASSGATPFGFAVTARDRLLVAKASGAVSSYDAAHDGRLTTVSASLSTHQAAACWLVVTKDGQFTYAANAGSGSISGYTVSTTGVLRPRSADGRTGVTNVSGATPLDMELSSDGHFLYVLETGPGTVGAFVIHADGSLANLPDTPGLAAAAGFQGLVAF